MSRKAVLGRAMLSSLDAQNNEFVDSSSMSQTDSWKFIDNFVRQNFIPDTLDQLNDQIKLEPKLTLAVPDSQSLRGNGEETLSQSFEPEQKPVDDTKTKENKSKPVSKGAERKGALKNGQKPKKNLKLIAATKSTVKRSTKKKNVNVAAASGSAMKNSTETKTKNTARNKRKTTEPEHQTATEMVQSRDSVLPFKTSTPERHEKQETPKKCICGNTINESSQKSAKKDEGKENVDVTARTIVNDCGQKRAKKQDNVEKNENVRSKEKVSKHDEQTENVATDTAQTMRYESPQKSVKKEEKGEINENARSKICKKVLKRNKRNENMVMVTARTIKKDCAQKCIKKEDNFEKNKNVRSKGKVSKHDERNKNLMKSVGKIKIKKYKKRLLEKGNKQLIRIIREIDDEEVRAEQAIEELSYNLSNIVKTMVYVQGETKTDRFKKNLHENIQLNKIIREIRDEEIKVQQAIEEFSRRLTNIAKTMRHIQESSLNSGTEDDDSSDFSEGSSYTSSSSFPCSSSCSCSCHNSSSSNSSYGSDEFSEYTLCSSSESDYSSDI
ncbi:uncharacterized protein LOC143154218 [Ptiloglossa arizonensis]|uniref:uncharacterized protein LOC143154218 n=1 Tax=Ptiloglossa arizonensis TaxID=3350558 RepID=UPI003F9F7F58